MTVPAMTLAHVNETILQIMFQFGNCLLLFFHHSNHINVNDVFHSICQRQACCPWSWLWKSMGCSPDSHSNCCAHSNSPCANVWSAVHQHRSGTSGPAKSGVWGVAVANMVIKSWNHVESPVSWVSRSDNETPTYGIYDKKQWTNNGKWGQHAKPSCPTWLPNFVKTDMEKTKAKWYSMLESCKSWTTIHRHWIEKYQNKTNHCHCNRFLDELPSFTGNYSRS